MTSPVDQLAALGVSVWLDDLSRSRLESGSLSELIATEHITGVTTNPAIFHQAFVGGQAYAPQLERAKSAGLTAAEAITEITAQDVREACDLFSDVYTRSSGVDGRVSIEVPPEYADDTEGTINAALDLWDRVDRDNCMIKIPATDAGFPAIATLIGRGISVNVTLIFSLQRYRQAVNAYLSGLEIARNNGRDLTRIHSVASFFVSRLDTVVDAQLRDLGTPEALALTGHAGVANAQMAYQVHKQMFHSERWHMLRAAGACQQRLLWASTGVKDPALAETFYVTELAGPGVVTTLPEHTLTALLNHAPFFKDTLSNTELASGRTLDQIQQLGIDYQAVTATLEHEGIARFLAAWQALTVEVSHCLES